MSLADFARAPRPIARRTRYAVVLAGIALGAVGCSVTGPDRGSLLVAILPGGGQTMLTITGPSGYSQEVNQTTTLTSLRPGSYTVSANTVTLSSGGGYTRGGVTCIETLTPNIPVQVLTVMDSHTTDAALVQYQSTGNCRP